MHKIILSDKIIFEEQKRQRQVSDDNVKKENSKIGLRGIAASIRNMPLSLNDLRDIQQQMASQIKAIGKNRNFKLKPTNQTEIGGI